MSFTDRLVLWLHIGFAIFALGPVTVAILSTPRYIRAQPDSGRLPAQDHQDLLGAVAGRAGLRPGPGSAQEGLLAPVADRLHDLVRGRAGAARADHAGPAQGDRGA